MNADNEMREQRVRLKLERREAIVAARKAYGDLLLGPRPSWWRFRARKTWDRRRLVLAEPKNARDAEINTEIAAEIALAVKARESMPDEVIVGVRDFWAMSRGLGAKMFQDDSGGEFMWFHFDAHRVRVRPTDDLALLAGKRFAFGGVA